MWLFCPAPTTAVMGSPLLPEAAPFCFAWFFIAKTHFLPMRGNPIFHSVVVVLSYVEPSHGLSAEKPFGDGKEGVLTHSSHTKSQPVKMELGILVLSKNPRCFSLRTIAWQGGQCMDNGNLRGQCIRWCGQWGDILQKRAPGV